MDYATIVLTGKSTNDLLKEIAEIKSWYGGHNYPVKVSADTGHVIIDYLDKIEAAICGDLCGYLNAHFGNKRNILKSGGNDDLYFVPNLEFEDGVFHKVRRRATNYTPPKKKRKKR